MQKGKAAFSLLSVERARMNWLLKTYNFRKDPSREDRKVAKISTPLLVAQKISLQCKHTGGIQTEVHNNALKSENICFLQHGYDKEIDMSIFE